MGRYSKDVTLSARLSEAEVAQVDRLREVAYGRGRYAYSTRKTSRSDVIRQAIADAEETLLKRDTAQAEQLRKLIPKEKKR